MTKEDFLAEINEHTCPFCKSVALFEIYKPQDRSPHEWGVRCGKCTTFYRWLSKEKNENKRPSLPAGTIPAIWEINQDYCACCGLHDSDLAVLGIGRTVQHTPPYDIAGDKAQLIPFCQWCKARSASEMVKLRALVKRLREKHAQ
jgi:hypothetical protein